VLTTYVPIVIAETSFTTAFVTAVETIGGTLRRRELMLRSWIEVVRGWAWEVGVGSGGALVVNGCTVSGFAAEPGDVVGTLLHDCGGRWRRASPKYTLPAKL